VKFDAFRQVAERAYDEIPEGYKQGIEGLVVSREAVKHPELDDLYTLGECLTENWPSEFQGPDTTRSSVVLYWGSFKNLAARDSEFDWEGEIWETLTHELRHHLESLAAEDALEDVDYAADEAYKREDGLPFDPWYYQKGEPAGAGVYRIEERIFIEQLWGRAAFEAAGEVPFVWAERRWAIPRPDRLGDVHYVLVHGVAADDQVLELVLVRRRSWWEQVKGALRGAELEVLESEAEAGDRGAA
jgi:predicted Zn-dependent protease with MMP-like domain